MVQPIIVLWSLLLDSLYWLGMTNEMADASDLHSHDKGVGIDRPLVGISFDHEAASELAQSLGSRSMRQVALIPHNRLKLNVHMSKLQLLGSGGTAKVYKGVYKMDRDSAKNCAVKVSFFVEFNADVIREVIREAELCGNIRHPRVVEFYGISVMPPSIALVFELCEHGSLEKFLRRGIGRMNEKNKLLLCLDCAVAVEYLHSIKSRLVVLIFSSTTWLFFCSDGLSFSHGDLKSPNFLVTRSGVVSFLIICTLSKPLTLSSCPI
jgi:serine/threonine protein kinase